MSFKSRNPESMSTPSTAADRWMLFYLQITWAMSAIGFNWLIFSIYESVRDAGLASHSSTLVVQCLVGMAALLSGISAWIYRSKIKAMRGKIPLTQRVTPYAFAWGLNNGVFLYGVLAFYVTGSALVAAPFYLVALGLSALQYPR